MRVTLVGAGPGDKGLLTLKGAERIKNADVVLFDRFVGKEILAMIPTAAEKIDVGKTAGIHPVPQEEINRLLLEKAGQGLDVVRLKGGDPFVFGRGAEELELLAENNIPFEVIPGVTSAIAAASYAGIPVTHRDYASSLHIITGHKKKNEELNIDYYALVRAKGTLVFMMGLAAIDEICNGLIAAGMDEYTPAAIVESATTGDQRKFIGTVGTLPAIAREKTIVSPEIFIIGKVCSLSGCCDWFGKKPLFGIRILVPRVMPGESKLSDRLGELGCNVIELPYAKITPLTAAGCLMENSLKKIHDYAWLVFTSGIGVNIFFDYLIAGGYDIRTLYRLKIACVGTETEKEINKRGVNVDYRPDEYNGSALACGLTGFVKHGERLLIAGDKDGAKDLTRILTDAGILFDDIGIYEKTMNVEKTSEKKFDLVAFTSSSAVEGFVEAFTDINFNTIKAVCIGGRTAAAAQSYGMEIFISTESTIESMVRKIEELCAHGS